MPLVNGKEFPYTPKGMAAAKKARKGSMTGSGMMNNPKQKAMANVEQEQSKKMDAMRNALSKAAAAKKPAPSAPKATLPAQAGVSGTPDFMPIKRGDALKKKNLAE